jgi:hypothetical protein
MLFSLFVKSLKAAKRKILHNHRLSEVARICFLRGLKRQGKGLCIPDQFHLIISQI